MVEPRIVIPMVAGSSPVRQPIYKNTLGLVIDHCGYSAFRAADLSVFLYMPLYANW